ncbi:MAG: response regulator [Elusimicrobia bacterium]|nr:response regulator [Elusimicrobiota bacterium]
MGEKLLVVDDDPEILRVMQDVLEAAGYQVRTCDSGRCVIDALKEFKPGLLLLDVMLPGVDGYTLALKITEDEATRDLPIIVLSGLEPSQAMFQRFKQVAAFIPKPFFPQELLEAVRKALLPKT